jgi:hypothetical protein
MSKLKNYILPVLTIIAAVSVSVSAAFYSVTGLMKLFAGSALSVGIMAGSLEFSKLVVASILSQYWDIFSKALKAYLVTAVVILVCITSIGIYGYLSSAYQETYNTYAVSELSKGGLESQRSIVSEALEEARELKSTTSVSISNLQQGLVDNRISYTDKNGNLVNTTSGSVRRSLETQIASQEEILKRNTQIVDSLSKKFLSLENKILTESSETLTVNELGPLIFLHELTDIPLTNIINYLLLIIICVFDPLALALVLSANIMLKSVTQKTNYSTSPTDQKKVQPTKIRRRRLITKTSQVKKAPVKKKVMTKKS